MEYEEPKSNEWVQPIKRNYRLRCCDCGLVHQMDFRVVAGRVQFRARRDGPETARVRFEMAAEELGAMIAAKMRQSKEPTDFPGEPPL